MIWLALDGQPIQVRAYTASAKGGPAAENGDAYRLEIEHADGTRERCWARCVGVQEYVRTGKLAC